MQGILWVIHILKLFKLCVDTNGLHGGIHSPHHRPAPAMLPWAVCTFQFLGPHTAPLHRRCEI